MDYIRQIYTVLVYSSYGLLTLTLIGVSSLAPAYLQLVRNIYHIFVAFFLIWQFNPLRAKRTLSSLEKDIVFASGLLLAASSTVGLVVSEYANSTVSAMSGHWLSASGAP